MEARIAATHRAGLRCCMVALTLAAPVGGRAAAQTTAPSIRVTPENVRFNNYLRDLAAPPALVGIVGSSLLQQIRPSQGAGARIAVSSPLELSGRPIIFIRPIFGCSISSTILRATMCGSASASS